MNVLPLNDPNSSRIQMHDAAKASRRAGETGRGCSVTISTSSNPAISIAPLSTRILLSTAAKLMSRMAAMFVRICQASWNDCARKKTQARQVM